MTDAIAAFDAKIAPELKEFVRPIGDATRHPDNIRKHRIDKIAQSLRSHGQRAAIVVQKSTGLIVKGNGTHEAAELLGWTELAQIWQEMNDQEALAFLYADNKASDFSSYDRDKTIAGLKKMVEGPGLFDTLWSVEELEDLIEGDAGVTTLAPAGTEAEQVRTQSGVPGDAPAAKAPPERMKEIPLVMTLADHAEFIDQLKALAKRYGTSGTINTIVTAVQKQHDEESAPKIDRRAVRRELVVELRDYYVSLGKDELPLAKVVSALETAEPYVSPLRQQEEEPEVDGQASIEEAVVVPGQTTLEEVGMVEPAPANLDEDVDDAAALAALAVYRKTADPEQKIVNGQAE